MEAFQKVTLGCSRGEAEGFENAPVKGRVVADDGLANSGFDVAC